MVEVAPSDPVEPEPGPDTVEPAPEPAPTAARRHVGILVLTVAAALLAVSTAVLGAGYASARHDVAARDRTLAAQAAELDRLRTELDTVVARRMELEAKLAGAEAKALDPAGYELIKRCVHDYADAERATREAIASGKALLAAGTGRPVLVNPKTLQVPTTCADAEPYLK